MKRAIAIFVLLAWASFAAAGEIDKLHTIKDVEQFLVKKVDSNIIRYIRSVDSIAGFFKIDIDRNGSTDLLINTRYSFAVFDTGNGKYYRRNIGAILIDVLYAKADLLIPTRRQVECYDSAGYKYDTLTFKFGAFIEYNGLPDQLEIAKIKLRTYNGYPGLNIELSIDASGWATCEEGFLPKIFAGIVDGDYLDRIRQTINYIKLFSLSDSYPIDGLECLPSDQEIFALEITFNNGQIKRIRDYGGSGTFGLSTLYEQLVNLVLEKKLDELH